MLNSPTLSNNNNNTTSSPIFYVNNILSYLEHDHYPSDNYSTSYYHLPSPLIYNEIDDFVSIHDLEFIQQSYLANNSSILTDDSSILEVDHNNKVDNSNKGNDEVNGIVEDSEIDHHKISSNKNNIIHGGLMKRKRTSNKDRHSKIRTAHGLRDRRMRLSLQVARPFFRLQDMLGFDKASRTVEWLLIKSKSSIEELIQSKHGSPSGVTKCTTISSTSDDCEVDSTTIEEQRKGCSKEKRVATCSARKDELMKRRKRTTKEERKVARERAKKRTLERKQSRGCQVNYNNNSSIKERNNNYVEVGEDNHHIIDDNVSRNWSPLTTTTLNHHQQSFEACHQNVTSYTISTQWNMVEGPQK